MHKKIIQEFISNLNRNYRNFNFLIQILPTFLIKPLL